MRHRTGTQHHHDTLLGPHVGIDESVVIQLSVVFNLLVHTPPTSPTPSRHLTISFILYKPTLPTLLFLPRSPFPPPFLHSPFPPVPSIHFTFSPRHISTFLPPPAKTTPEDKNKREKNPVVDVSRKKKTRVYSRKKRPEKRDCDEAWKIK